MVFAMSTRTERARYELADGVEGSITHSHLHHYAFSQSWQVFLCFLGGVYAGIRAAGSDVERMYFIWGEGGGPQNPALTAFLKFWSFIIIFTNFVPISLLVTLDMVKMCQSKIIGWDRQMYHEAREFDGTERPMPAQVCVRNRACACESGRSTKRQRLSFVLTPSFSSSCLPLLYYMYPM